MSAKWRAVRVATLLAVAMTVLIPAVAGAVSAPAGVSFGTPEATARLGEPVTFRTTFQTELAPVRVELVTSLPAMTATSVNEAVVSSQGGTSYSALVEQEGHATPNMTFIYRFRAVLADGTTVDGPQASATVVDERFEWRTLEGPVVRLHWYEGDEAFARSALEIGEAAIADASELLGVTETEPIDFFIYASEPDFREALGPGTRENVGGQANSAIRTLFGLIEPTDIGSAWVPILVKHELTHLVFATAVGNPYHEPPRWLNEGLAVYLSEGYGAGDQVIVESAARNGDLIPLEALGGLFPTTRERFGQAYAESISSVDFFIRTYGQDALVSLIRSYANGVTDDEAFTAATGVDVGAFDSAWVTSVGGTMPEPSGPQPAPPGPLPPGWTAGIGVRLAGAAIIVGGLWWRRRDGSRC